MLLVLGAVLALVVAVVVIAGLAYSNQHEKAQEASVKEGIHTILVGVQVCAVDHNDLYPDPTLVSQSGMASSLDFWPTNPYTGMPMTQGTGPGDFAYTRGGDGASFTLVGYGKSGTILMQVH